MVFDAPRRGTTRTVSDGVVDADVLAASLRRLDGGTLEALVADLWSARGYAIARDDGVVLATRDGESTVLYCAAPGRPRPERAVDVVVAPGAASRDDDTGARLGGRVLGADDLGDMLLYGVDRATGRRLCERHLGAPPEALERPLRDRVHRRVASARERTPPLPVLAVALALIALAVTVGGLGPTELGGAVAAVGSTLGDGPVEGDDATVEPVGDAPASESYPPGIGPDGIENPEALAMSHRRTFAGASYSVWVNLYQPRRSTQRQRRVRHDVDARVDGRQYEVEWSVDTPETSKPVLTVFRDDTGRYLLDATGNGTSHRPADRYPATPVPEPFQLREVLVTRYLATAESTIVATFSADGRTQYRIDGTGAPAVAAMADVTDYEVVAVVDERGFVRKFVADYTVLTDGGSYDVRLQVRYGRIGTTTVDRPSWVDRIDGAEEGTPANGTAEDLVGSTAESE